MLKGDGKGNFKAVKGTENGLHIQGAVRDAVWLKAGNKKLLLVAKNNASLQVIDYLK